MLYRRAVEPSVTNTEATWRHGPPLGEDVVAIFEAEHGIRLPEPYRTFVATIGDGADGPPHYGLLPLGQASDTDSHPVAAGSLREPFPLTDSWVWEGDSSADDAEVESVHLSGILPLGTDGDGMDYVLVVTGPARGQVWLITGEGAVPVAADFAKWMAGDVVPGAQWTLQDRRPR